MTEKSVGSSPGADLVFGTSFSSPGSCHGHSLLLALLSQHSSGQCLAPKMWASAQTCPAPTCWMLPKHQLDGKAIGPLRPAGGMDMALGVFFPVFHPGALNDDPIIGVLCLSSYVESSKQPLEEPSETGSVDAWAVRKEGTCFWRMCGQPNATNLPINQACGGNFTPLPSGNLT